MIVNWIRWLTSPPVFADEEQMRNGRILNAVLWASCASVFFLGLMAPFIYQAAGYIIGAAVVALLIIVAALFLLKRGYLPQASWLLSASIWLLLSLFAIYSGGIQTDAYKSQFIVILVSGILLGWRVGFSFVFLSLLWGLVLIFMERQQMLPPPILASSDPISSWVSTAITFMMTAVWLHIATNNTQRILVQLRHSNNELQVQTRELDALRQISLELVANLDLESLLRNTMKTAIELLDGMAGGLFLYRADEQVLELVANYNEMNPIGSKLQLNQGLAGAVWLSDTPIIVGNYREWSGHIPDFVSFIGDRSLIGIALQRGDERVGVLTMVGADGRSYDQHDVALLNLFIAGATIAIQNARLHLQHQQVGIALRDSEKAARVLLNAPPDDFFLLDKSGLILDLNETAAHNLGQPTSTLIHQVVVYDLFAEDVAVARRQMVEGVLATGATTHYEDQRNGRWYDNRLYPIFDTEGQAVRLAVYARDITEQKAAEAERESLIADLEAKNEELERFTYTVSHDLKSPLVTILGFLGFVERDAAAGKLERLNSDIVKIRDAAEKMKLLLNNLLELSRIGRLINPPTQIPFAEIVQEALTIVSGAITARGIRVEVADNLPTVTADRMRLVEVVQNLVDNATRFMGEQPSPYILIGVRYDEGTSQPIYFVQDNGVGIAPQYHENIFGLFNRLNPNIEGTGIGLTLVRRIIEVHGGRVWVESAVGEGATFCFTLR